MHDDLRHSNAYLGNEHDPHSDTSDDVIPQILPEVVFCHPAKARNKDQGERSQAGSPRLPLAPRVLAIELFDDLIDSSLFVSASGVATSVLNWGSHECRWERFLTCAQG